MFFIKLINYFQKVKNNLKTNFQICNKMFNEDEIQKIY